MLEPTTAPSTPPTAAPLWPFTLWPIAAPMPPPRIAPRSGSPAWALGATAAAATSVANEATRMGLRSSSMSGLLLEFPGTVDPRLRGESLRPALSGLYLLTRGLAVRGTHPQLVTLGPGRLRRYLKNVSNQVFGLCRADLAAGRLGEGAPRFRAREPAGNERRGQVDSARHDRPETGRDPPRCVDRREHARLRALRVERCARNRRGCDCDPRWQESAQASRAHVAGDPRDALLRGAAHVPGRRRARDEDGALCALEPRGCTPAQGSRVLGSARHRRRWADGLHAPGLRGRRAGRAARKSRGDGAPASRGSTAVLQALPRGPHRQLRRAPRSGPVLPLRQPVRLQPEFPVQVAAGARAGGRGGLSRERPGDARRDRLFDPAPRDLCVAQPAYVRRRADPPPRRQARPQDGPDRPRDLSPGRGVGEGAHGLPDG